MLWKDNYPIFAFPIEGNSFSFYSPSAESRLNEHGEEDNATQRAYVSRQSKWAIIQLYVKWYSHASYLLVIGPICMQMDCTYLMMSADLVQLHQRMCRDFFPFFASVPLCARWIKTVMFTLPAFFTCCFHGNGDRRPSTILPRGGTIVCDFPAPLYVHLSGTSDRSRLLQLLINYEEDAVVFE